MGFLKLRKDKGFSPSPTLKSNPIEGERANVIVRVAGSARSAPGWENLLGPGLGRGIFRVVDDAGSRTGALG